MVEVVAVLILLLVTYLWVGFYLAVMRTVSQLGQAATRMVQGSTAMPVALDNQDELGMDKLKEYAQKVGIDVLRWEQDFNSPEVQQQLSREADEGRAAGVDSTPSFFVNGRRITQGTTEEFKGLIQEALKGNR